MTALPRAHAGTAYFQIAEPAGLENNRDSYVLPLTDPSDIAHARDLIARGPQEAGSSIVFAHIARGSGGGINRDLLAPDHPEWSWHVDRFDGFGDFGIELTDGWPGHIEANLDQWIAETGGNIGFWSYTVTAELRGYPDVRPPGPGNAVPLPAMFPIAALTLAGVGFLHYRAKRRARRG